MLNHLQSLLLGMTMFLVNLKGYLKEEKSIESVQEQLVSYETTLGEQSIICMALRDTIAAHKRMRRSYLVFGIWGLAITVATALHYFGLL